jgi:hypothetical protein
MQNCGVVNSALRQQGGPIVGRFVSKLVVEVLPAALASLIGGFLFTQYQAGRHEPAQPVAVQVAPASAEMMALLRDEHTAIVGYLKAQLTSEKSRIAAQDQEDARAAADAKMAAADAQATADAKAAALASADAKVEAKTAADAKALAAAATRRLAAVAAAKPAHAKPAPAATTVAATTHEPLVIARADLPDTAQPARDPDSLLSKTLDLKDHVVRATKSMVSAIGDIPSWIADRITPSQAAPAPQRFSDNS